MLQFIKKILIFISPFMILIALEVMIDPFNYFSPEKDKELLELKNALARKKNTYLYRLIEYERDPTPVIVLGDSRAQRLNAEFFEEVNGKKVINLAARPGSSGNSGHTRMTDWRWVEYIVRFFPAGNRSFPGVPHPDHSVLYASGAMFLYKYPEG